MSALYLRVDVCTRRGLHRGVPALLDVLRRAGVRATFFVTLGPDRTGRALVHLLRPDFARRVFGLGGGRTYGFRAALYGTVLAAPRVAEGASSLLRRIEGEGHELAPHGWDHRGWQDGLDAYPEGRLRREFRRMMETYEGILGHPAGAFAAPAWRVNRALLELEEEADLAFASDARGAFPFRAVWEDRTFRVPQLPVTLPTLDERTGPGGAEGFFAELLGRLRGAGPYACYAAHAEVEGGPFREAFERFLRLVDRPIRPLGTAPRDRLPPHVLTRRVIPGRPWPGGAQGPPREGGDAG